MKRKTQFRFVPGSYETEQVDQNMRGLNKPVAVILLGELQKTPYLLYIAQIEK